MLNYISEFLGSALTPLILFLTSASLIPYVRTSPKNFVKSLKDSSSKSSWKALSVALAGTLGVGNITGVASAIICGGAGAVFWMWVGSLVVISVKYAEVYLAVLYRRRDKKGWYGGAMYYIRDGLGKIIGGRQAEIFGGIFAVLCIANSLITGNIVQANSAACVLPEKFRLYSGIILGVLVLLSIIYGTRRIEKITSAVVPPLAGFYMTVCIYVIAANIGLMPKILADILSSAFTGRAIYGGGVGFCMREAVRYGVMRGIFSNEAGCGTSPSAHASADTKCPHSQALCGIIEVVFDTLILCSMTAFVLLIADSKFGMIPWHTERDTSAVTLEAFGILTNDFVYVVLCAAVVMFAYATIIAQIYYGTAAIRYLTKSKWLNIAYSALSITCPIVGSVISAHDMWTAADIIIGIMTSANCIVLILLRKECRNQ